MVLVTFQEISGKYFKPTYEYFIISYIGHILKPGYIKLNL